MHGISHGNNHYKWQCIDQNFHTAEISRKSINPKRSQSDNTKRNDKIENGSSQPEFNNHRFKLRIVIHGIILYIEHNTKDSDEHKIFNEEEKTDQR